MTALVALLLPLNFAKADALSNVKSSGKLIFGREAGYKPFEFCYFPRWDIAKMARFTSDSHLQIVALFLWIFAATNCWSLMIQFHFKFESSIFPFEKVIGFERLMIKAFKVKFDLLKSEMVGNHGYAAPTCFEGLEVSFWFDSQRWCWTFSLLLRN